MCGTLVVKVEVSLLSNSPVYNLKTVTSLEGKWVRSPSFSGGTNVLRVHNRRVLVQEVGKAKDSEKVQVLLEKSKNQWRNWKILSAPSSHKAPLRPPLSNFLTFLYFRSLLFEN